MKKIIWNIGLILLIGILLVGCKKSALSEKELINILPEDIVSYMLENELYQSEVTNLEIERRQTNNKSDTVDAIISLEDDYTERTIYATLHLEYYDTGGWQIDSWSPYSDEICTPKIAPDENKILQKAKNAGVTNMEKTDEYLDLSSGTYTCTYSVSEEHAYITFKGDLYISAYFAHERVDTDRGMMTHCSWEYEREDGTLIPEWNVLGNWSGNEGPKNDVGLYDSRFDVTLKGLDEKYVNEGSVPVSGNYFYAAVLPGSSRHTGEEIARNFEKGSYWIDGEVSSKMYPLTLHITVGTGSSGQTITFEFTADSVSVKGNDGYEYENIKRN